MAKIAKYVKTVPDDVLRDLQELDETSESIFKAMVSAGAADALQRVYARLPKGIYNSRMRKNLMITKAYWTPSDEGYNCRVAFYGYFRNRDKRLYPAPLVANMFEYGSKRGRKYPRQSFMVQAFAPSLIDTDLERAWIRLTRGKYEG